MAIIGLDDELHPATRKLVIEFAEAMGAKLARAQRKYGVMDDWLTGDWHDRWEGEFVHHLAKGDPLDVAIYCAFAWHHGWKTDVAL